MGRTVQRRVNAPALLAAVIASAIIMTPFAAFAWLVLERMSS